MNRPLECATRFVGAVENETLSPAHKEVFDLMELLTKGFPKHGRAVSDAPIEFCKDFDHQSNQTSTPKRK